MSSPFQKQFSAKTPFKIEENPTEEKLGRETGSTKTTGDVYKGKETTIIRACVNTIGTQQYYVPAKPI